MRNERLYKKLNRINIKRIDLLCISMTCLDGALLQLKENSNKKTIKNIRSCLKVANKNIEKVWEDIVLEETIKKN